MYIDADTIIKAASLLGALGALAAAVIAVYKVVDINRKQTEIINAMQEEQTLICYGLRGALQGLIEQGCNGPCKDALDKLDKHLNKSAHPHVPEG
ncbi:MAG: branched-chain amino acid ABC transporter permease [Eubacteriales bacterium]|nr:branched-chain amino acid ABC transporter permease [Eubacteriales bacterium]